MALFTPVNQRRHTNVAIVRLKRGGKRFELAAYPNKVQGWRNGVEKALDEVLQTPKIFINVSQGEYAKKEDLKAAFETDDTDAIIKIILEKGEIQVSEKERGLMLESLFKDIATVVSEKCVDPGTKRPIPVGNVERAMRDMHYSVNPHRNAKQQALDVIRLLKERIPIERAQMQLKIVGPAAASKEKLSTLYSAVEKEETEGKYECVCFIDPVNFRKIEEVLKAEGKGTATVDVLSLAAYKETTDAKALPSGSGEEADDEDDKAKVEAEEETGTKKPQPTAQRRRGQKMPGEPDSEEDSSDDKKKGKGKKGAGGRKKKPAAAIVTSKPVPKGKAAPKPAAPAPSDDSEEQDELVHNLQVMALKQPALPKRSALTSGSEAEAEDAAKPPVPKGKGGKAKGKAKGRAPPSAFSALANDDG